MWSGGVEEQEEKGTPSRAHGISKGAEVRVRRVCGGHRGKTTWWSRCVLERNEIQLVCALGPESENMGSGTHCDLCPCTGHILSGLTSFMWIIIIPLDDLYNLLPAVATEIPWSSKLLGRRHTSPLVAKGPGGNRTNATKNKQTKIPIF